MDENGVQDSFVWENQGWAFSNSDYSGGGSGEKPGKKVPHSNASNSQSPPSEADVAPFAGGKRVASSGNNDGDGGELADHDGHIWTERERRKRMRNMFTNLHALLPQLPPKVDKSTIVDEAVNYIKTLQETLHNLQKQKLERLQSLKTGTDYDYPPIVASKNLDMTEMTTREAFLADQGCVSNCAFAPADAKNISHLTPIYPAVFKTWTSPNVALNVCGYDAHISVCCPTKHGLLATICYVLDKYKIEVVSAHVLSEQHRSMYMIHARVTSGYVNQFPVEEIYKQAAGELIVLCG